MEHCKEWVRENNKKHVAKNLSLTGIYVGGKKNIVFRINLCMTKKNTIFVNCIRAGL